MGAWGLQAQGLFPGPSERPSIRPRVSDLQPPHPPCRKSLLDPGPLIALDQAPGSNDAGPLPSGNHQEAVVCWAGGSTSMELVQDALGAPRSRSLSCRSVDQWTGPQDRHCWRLRLHKPRPGVVSGEGNGNPLQYSCLGSPMDGGAWRATVHGVTKSQTRLSSQQFPLGHETG